MLVIQEHGATVPTVIFNFFNYKKNREVASNSVFIGESSGLMTKRFALLHEYNSKSGYYYSYNELRKCQNPGHGGWIRHVYILRHKLSGGEVEVGKICFQRWRLLNGLSTDPWFDDYLVGKERWGKESPEKRISYTEDRKIEREQRAKWLKKNKIKLKKEYHPLRNYTTIEAADDFARGKGGYCSSSIEMVTVPKEIKCQRGHRIFSLYVREETETTIVPKEQYLKITNNKNCPRCGSSVKINILNTEKSWVMYINPDFEEGQYIKF